MDTIHRIEPKIGDYVVPDGWPNGIGGLLLAGHEPIGAPWNYAGSSFCIQGQHIASPINVTITGRLVNYGRFRQPAMRCRIEWLRDGEPSEFSLGWIVEN